MERGLEEASVRGKNECQVKLVDTEKGLGSHFRSGLDFIVFIFQIMRRNSSNTSLLKSIIKAQLIQ